MKSLQLKIALIVVTALMLSGCGLRFGNRLQNGGSAGVPTIPQGPPTQIPTNPPTRTPVPTATATSTPAPNPAAVGLPAETSGSQPLDFVASMCKAEWFTKAGTLPCPGDENKSNGGFVLAMPAEKQGLASGFPVLLMYPPQATSDTISGKYPAFQVRKGDRFRAVLECRLHSFCDVDFGLDYYGAGGAKSGLTHWPYRFTDTPVVIDYSLDGLAGLTVQFSLWMKAAGPSIDAYGVWILPHIYRPAP
jgi:hypothetical protein